MSLVSPGDDVDAGPIDLMSDRTIDKPIGRILAAVTQSFASNVIAACVFGAEDYDTNNMHDIVTNPSRIIVPTGYAGYWSFEGTIVYGARTDYQVTDSWWRKNGATNIPCGSRQSRTNGSVSSFQAQFAKCTVFLDPALGDYVELMGVQTNVAAAAQVTALAGQHICTAEWRFERR